MYKLKFDEGVCASCTTCDCLMKCQYIKLDIERAKEERWKIIRGEDSLVLTECATCYACEEYCPYGNHPFYQIVELQEARGIHPAPKPIEKQQARMLAPEGAIDYRQLSAPVIDMCAFGMFEKFSIQGKLFEGVATISGNDIFCNLMYLHFAGNSIIKERLPKIVENIRKYYVEKNNLDEVICFHDECYATFKSWAPAFGVEVPFKPVYFFEFLLREMRKRKSEIRQIPMKAAYQRPCSNRLIPETQPLVDELFELVGAERVQRKYDRENALCCGAVIMTHGRDDLAEDTRKRNIEDMKEAGATACVFNCPYCLVALGEAVAQEGIMPLLMSDLCRLALGEQLKGLGE
ncbi:MAG: (Fe-S)-binding protein [Candidatus Lindowbacteria bacterium]|nr:(Fe-S)-binding protein [Candidatus Lindowbacteria bacterium]